LQPEYRHGSAHEGISWLFDLTDRKAQIPLRHEQEFRMASRTELALPVSQLLEISFPTFTPRITVNSERELTVEIVAADNLGFSNTVDYEAVAVRGGLKVLSWQEQSGRTIVPVLDVISREARRSQQRKGIHAAKGPH
jgi:hypothetical protein